MVRWTTVLGLFTACLAVAQDDALVAAYSTNAVVRQGRSVLWHDPGAVESRDLRYGIGGPDFVPAAPFQFVDEDLSGHSPKVRVRDAREREWVVKFGKEARSDAFCTRIAWSVGYYVEPEYLVPEGVITGARNLKRASSEIDSGGRFRDGRFQLRMKEPRYFKLANWAWDDNPFLGTPELGGLKVLMMLLSNWDNKDARDTEERGSNTAIYYLGNRLIFFVEDWGGAMGNWGKFFTRSKWNAEEFHRQSDDFVSVKDGQLRWGYVGQHSALLKSDVKIDDVRWLMQYLGRLTDRQLREALLSSGATEEETQYYVAGLRTRLNQLKAVAALPVTSEVRSRQ